MHQLWPVCSMWVVEDRKKTERRREIEKNTIGHFHISLFTHAPQPRLCAHAPLGNRLDESSFVCLSSHTQLPPSYPMFAWHMLHYPASCISFFLVLLFFAAYSPQLPKGKREPLAKRFAFGAPSMSHGHVHVSLVMLSYFSYFSCLSCFSCERDTQNLGWLCEQPSFWYPTLTSEGTLLMHIRSFFLSFPSLSSHFHAPWSYLCACGPFIPYLFPVVIHIFTYREIMGAIGFGLLACLA